MSDRDIGKKEMETDEVLLFLDAREWTTDEELVLVARCESPDFICSRRDGQRVGIELTKVMRDPRDASWDRILEGKGAMDPYEAQERICQVIENKEEARRARYVRKVTQTVLVIHLFDGSLDSLMPYLEDLEGELADHGFAEVWVADYSGREAYGDVELFGLFPEEWWGYHQRPRPYRKPYG
jgi:hypothetical protein